MDAPTTAELVTVAGASAAALVFAQFGKMLFNLTAKWVRSIALVAGLAVVVVTTVITADALDVGQLLLAIIVGMQAGLAAVALFDTTRAGLGYQVSPDEPTEAEPPA